ncbi:hydroxysqualene dehydroxylase [Haloarchaeobius iranensis]|uniref:NAD-binding domain and a Fe-S cluster-containing protein n=1 Tax=Haloarchaeobius iranensis TaxID=996166 RepID=A0A1G9W2Z3_9EURY|nr:FAD-dependent oxidoreductase [Haloarchaeobius iranensis]SDM78561.1 NAD-binding domain and a Fe-S cluster-containing protein [Haloarchaeobius iranensis]
MTRTVAILGGGIGGLSAAHELAERGFDVTVYERNDRFGGKARSFPGPADGDAHLPAEHGFRFFPGFYRHVTDTMSRIPVDGGTVVDRLTTTDELLQAVTDGDDRLMRVEAPRSVREWRERIQTVFGSDVPRDEAAFFANRLLTLLSSSERRWREEYEHRSWWEFIRAEEMSQAYQTYLGYGITQSLVAMRPQVSSTRTIGRIYLQMLRGLFDPELPADRLLDGPTNEAWIDPWVDHLRRRGVDLVPNAAVTAVDADGERVTGATVRHDGPDGDAERVEADHYVLAVPAPAVDDLLTPELERAAPSLSGVRNLDHGWMNGVQFYLREDVAPVRGHGVFYDSPWALTAVSQRQFWERYDWNALAETEGVLSVIVSEWDEPGIVYGKPARECTREEIVTEVWEQLRAHLGTDLLNESTLVASQLDPAVGFDEETGTVTNDAELLINTVGSLEHRPEAATECPNLYLAADYVRTETDLASMECANEAARRAVNALLDDLGHPSKRCEVWPFEWPAVFAPLRRQDDLGQRLGLTHPGEGASSLWSAYRDVVRP